MPDHVVPLDFDKLINRSFCIGIQRRNLIDQITSFYICDKTQKWHRTKNEKTQDYQVEIDDNSIENQIQYHLLVIHNRAYYLIM